MLTARGWWFLLVVLGLLAFAGLTPPRGLTALSLIGLTLLAWFLWEWLHFAIQVRWGFRQLRVEREVRDDRGPMDVLWAGQPFEVRVRIAVRGWLGVPYVFAADRVPFGVETSGGKSQGSGQPATDEPLQLAYHLRCPGPGRLRFEGVGLRLVDVHGFFHYRTFVVDGRTVRVLPPVANAEGHVPSVKRHNLLPPPGVHRHRRPGSGSELLDLRDYLPGDPPKLIAWKVSARRDRLITKEFESEVPVRCTLFVDTSQSVRVGPPRQNALCRLVEISGVVAQAAVGNRDLVGLVLVDEEQASFLAPGRTPRHLGQLLNRLTDAAGLAPATGAADLRQLLPLAAAFAHEVYPGLMRPALNRVPFWMPWLWAPPRLSQRQTESARFGWLRATLMVGPIAVYAALIYLIFGLPGVIGLFGLAAAATLMGRWFQQLIWPVLPQFFSPRRRRLVRWRKRLAALLAARYHLGPGGLSRLLEDDQALLPLLQRFLAEHDVPFPLPYYDRQGRYLFAAAGKVDVLARALVQTVSRGRDNELFVLLADLLELEDALGPLSRALTLARARHHRVVVVCPWPAGVELPPGDPGVCRTPGTVGQAEAGVQPALRRATQTRFHQAYAQLRRALARLGVPLLCAAEGDPAHRILDRLEQLRRLGRTR